MYYECRHIYPRGSRCKSPALRGESFCYYHRANHQPGHQPSAGPRSTTSPATHAASTSKTRKAPALQLPALEDTQSIQQALSQVLAALAAGQVTPRTAGLLLYGLQVAAVNARMLDKTTPSHVVRHAHTLPDGSLIADLAIAEDYWDTNASGRNFLAANPPHTEPGEQPLCTQPGPAGTLDEIEEDEAEEEDAPREEGEEEDEEGVSEESDEDNHGKTEARSEQVSKSASQQVSGKAAAPANCELLDLQASAKSPTNQGLPVRQDRPSRRLRSRKKKAPSSRPERSAVEKPAVFRSATTKKGAPCLDSKTWDSGTSCPRIALAKKASLSVR